MTCRLPVEYRKGYETVNYIEHITKQAIDLGIFEPVESIAMDAYGNFTIADPFKSDAEFKEWKAKQRSLPKWIMICHDLESFTGQAEDLMGAIEQFQNEGILDQIRAAYNKK